MVKKCKYRMQINYLFYDAVLEFNPKTKVNRITHHRNKVGDQVRVSPAAGRSGISSSFLQTVQFQGDSPIGFRLSAVPVCV